MKSGENAVAVKTIVESVRDSLGDEMRRDWRVIVLGEDVGVHGGVFRATDGLQAEFGADRVIDTPIAELGIVGTAIGSALNGLRPVAEIQFADYIFPAMDQIVNEAAKIRYRSNGAWSCPLVIRAPYGAGVHGALYHSQSVEAFFPTSRVSRSSRRRRPTTPRGCSRPPFATRTRSSTSSTSASTAASAARCRTTTT